MSAELRRSAIAGLAGGAVSVHAGFVGMITAFQGRAIIAGVINLGSLLPLLVAFIVGWVAARQLLQPGRAEAAGRNAVLLNGVVAGLVAAAVLALTLVLISVVNVQGVLINATSRLVEAVHFGLGLLPGTLATLAIGAVAGGAGAALHVLPRTLGRAVSIGLIVTLSVALLQPFIGGVLRNVGLDPIEDLLFEGAALSWISALALFAIVTSAAFGWQRGGGRAVQRRYDRAQKRGPMLTKIVVFGFVALLLLLLPQIVGQRLSFIINQVGIYVLLGLGLNIVVGFAGLLDLGYVAFYAVGAYTIAILTSPASPAFSPEMSFWAALPIVVIIAAIVGLMIGAPVLRLRGDYLAIVTLGFGEIARIIFLSQWAAPVTGGAQGILSIPPPLPFTRDQQVIYYPILLFCVVAALGALSLSSSRVGRAWNAMREDEAVAEATGVSTVKYKLLAFALGAAFGCLSGAIFAAWIGTIFANSFEILVSINALALIILGGMGNILGVVVGAFVLVGLPEVLREFAEFRLLLYGAVLVVMMLLRPEGLLPSRSRRAELHERDDEEDQFDEEAGVGTPAPAVSS